jgi:hypothetical protein
MISCYIRKLKGSRIRDLIQQLKHVFLANLGHQGEATTILGLLGC